MKCESMHPSLIFLSKFSVLQEEVVEMESEEGQGDQEGLVCVEAKSYMYILSIKT
jgi:hypothetical protein